MSALLVGYARCSTDQQDLTARRDALLVLGVEVDRIYVDHGLTGTSAVSVTWAMTAPPRGEVYSSVLHGLLNPHAEIDRKRVTLVFRPLDPARAVRIVEIDKRAADFRATVSDRPSARAINEQRSAAATAAEEALGAGLVDFSVFVTATVADEQRLPDAIAAIAAIDMLSASARLQLRPMYGSQDVGFAASLPLGLMLPAHSALPSSVRSAL